MLLSELLNVDWKEADRYKETFGFSFLKTPFSVVPLYLLFIEPGRCQSAYQRFLIRHFRWRRADHFFKCHETVCVCSTGASWETKKTHFPFGLPFHGSIKHGAFHSIKVLNISSELGILKWFRSCCPLGKLLLLSLPLPRYLKHVQQSTLNANSRITTANQDRRYNQHKLKEPGLGLGLENLGQYGKKKEVLKQWLVFNCEQ